LVNAHQGVIYQMEHQDRPGLKLLASYSNARQNGYPTYLDLGEGFIGQCAADKKRILISKIPRDAVPIGTALFHVLPRSLVVFPIIFEDEVKAVIGLASLEDFATVHLSFLEELTSNIGIVLNSIEVTMQTEALLKQSQQLAAELQTQKKELQQTNEQLAQKAQQLVEQNIEVERKNREIERARRAVEEKAAELALTSKYKSDFLANMSHELRTPLNSILILGQQLGENPTGTLTPKQVEFARTIHAAGTDLLSLISDILDLSKIESGTVTLDVEEVHFAHLLDVVERTFRHEAENRNLSFAVQRDPQLGRGLSTDSKRLQQVLKNLLSNAFKFTEQGGVELRVSAAENGWMPDHPVLNNATAVIAFEVCDTGVGIPAEKQKIIFEAFQQADAGTSRKFGGTGLGLAISRELTNLLGGEIHLRSEPGKGSTFTLYVPQIFAGPISTMRTAEPSIAVTQPVAVAGRASERSDLVTDDREELKDDDLILLIVEDDTLYARVLVDLARDTGFKVLIATRGAEAISLARQFRPSAVSLDIFLPDMLGWTVLNELKLEPATRHIPVQIISLDEDRQHGLSRGAFSYLVKPVTNDDLGVALSRLKEYATPRRRQLLIVEDNAAERMSIAELLGHEDIDVFTAGTGAAGLERLRKKKFDCVALDLRLPDISGIDVLEEIAKEDPVLDVPMVVFTAGKVSTEQQARLHKLARNVVVKGAESPERLLDETSLFLHRVVADMAPERQQMLERLHRSDENLVDRQVLIVDDDVRNIFALSSVLERRGMRVLTASTGHEAIEAMETTPDLAIILMDIMMPGMDGYQTMRVIRQNPSWERLPIIALTARAMKGDREKCLEAGSSDYLAKPVNTEQLLSTLRLWLHR
jgi:signal transduction histidine kinase/CheY-like chemotaxis protein